MTREERNRKISELRDEWDIGSNDWMCQSDDNKPLNWHADANWPTLLREMPKAKLTRDDWAHNELWWFCESSDTSKETRSLDVADAVCEAWLHWKAAK